MVERTIKAIKTHNLHDNSLGGFDRNHFQDIHIIIECREASKEIVNSWKNTIKPLFEVSDGLF
jgi:hypothetical protein